MKKVCFIGGYKKTDMILYIAKMLTLANKSVLVIDATTEQRAKYVVPSIKPTFSYITNYENIDVAIGFLNLLEIKDYLSEEEPNYDYALIDIDNSQAAENFQIENSFKKYFVTSFDLYSIKKGLQILEKLEQPIELTKVLFSKEILSEENEYLDFLSLGYKVKWNEYRVYFPFEMGDETAIIDNQRLSKIKFKNLTTQYKEGLMYIAEELLEKNEINNFVKALRNFEKGE